MKPDLPDDPEAAKEWERLYRWCVYCGADCWVDEPDHGDDCPKVTGRYPVDHPAERGVERGGGPTFCCRCEKQLQGFYRLVCIDEGTPPVYESVCEDCALTAFMDAA